MELDVLLGGDALVPAALGTDAERLLELLAQVEVAATVALLPRVRRDLQAFAIRGARFPFLLEPGHHCHGRRGAKVMGYPASGNPNLARRYRPRQTPGVKSLSELEIA
jgi:hypothetical protein